jgi:hypothetical protein
MISQGLTAIGSNTLWTSSLHGETK